MDYFVQTFPRKGKIPNGDSYQVYEDDAIFIGCVADGVGGRPCDWKASKEVCEDFVYYFNELRPDSGNPFYTAQDSLRKTYAKLYHRGGACGGMLSTLVCVIIDKSTHAYFYLSIGDSKILRIEAEKAVVISRETDFEIPIDLLPGYVQTGKELALNASFVLVSDGFWANRKAYDAELQFAVNGPDWKSSVAQLFEINKMTQFDDMTVMVIKT